jgi:hypothetical protein
VLEPCSHRSHMSASNDSDFECRRHFILIDQTPKLKLLPPPQLASAFRGLLFFENNEKYSSDVC